MNTLPRLEVYTPESNDLNSNFRRISYIYNMLRNKFLLN